MYSLPSASVTRPPRPLSTKMGYSPSIKSEGFRAPRTPPGIRSRASSNVAWLLVILSFSALFMISFLWLESDTGFCSKTLVAGECWSNGLNAILQYSLTPIWCYQ